MAPSNQIDIVAVSDATTNSHSFKNPNWKAPKRRHKPQKQILNDDLKRVQQLMTENNKLDHLSYHSITAPPSLKPIKTYCDITGLPTVYKSPHNQVRYYNKEVYEIVKHMSPGVDQQYLALRGANVVLK